MKSQSQVESRLKKLRSRYAHKHVEASQQRCFRNCVFNLEHAPKEFDYSPPLETEMELAPRIQKTMVVFGDDRTVHLCMYGADNASTWPGDTCDTDEKAKHCPMFKPRVSLEQARAEFMEKLADDEYVFDHFRDVATLQWVVGERVHEIPLTLMDRILFWLRAKLWKPIPALPQLPPPNIPDGLWDNDPPKTS